MSGNWRAGFGQLAIALFLGGVTVPCWESIVLAQIIPDETLGAESSVVTPDNIKGLESDRISGGAVRGSNLFHSFQEFNIGEGRGGYFENPAVIENIFSRVTGGNPSNILGTLGVLGDANLFFLNPNGIIFGENASLDLKGSFLATTADSIVFPNGNQFSGTNPDAPPLLTVNVQQPIGLEFQGREGAISNLGKLDVEPDQNLALVGGDVTLDGGSLIAQGGRVELGGLSAAGEIGLSEDGSLSFPDGVARADVSLTNEAEVNVRAGGGGSIAINSRNLEVLGTSQMLAGIVSGLGSIDSKAGDIDLDSTETITLDDSSLISNAVTPDAVGNGGDVKVTTDSLLLTGGAKIGSNTCGQGDAGGIDITTTNLSLTQGSQVNASTFGQGNAGAVNVNASGAISVDGEGQAGSESSIFSSGSESGIFSEVDEFGVGNSGGIKITTANLSLTRGGELEASTKGTGNAGAVTVKASGTISVDGETQAGSASGIFSEVDESGIGNSGGIEITTANLSLTRGGRIDASTEGKDNAGAITINTFDNISVDGKGQYGFPTGIFSIVEENTAKGNAGGIDITTENLSLTRGGRLDTSTFGQGDGGDITINATKVSLTNGGFIFSNGGSTARGDVGSITINTTDAITVSQRSSIVNQIASSATGNSLGIKITTADLFLTEGGVIDSSTWGEGNAGEITIKASGTISVDGEGQDGFPSRILSQVNPTGIGNSGGINITTTNLFSDRR